MVNRHVIGEQRFEINLASVESAQDIQQRLSAQFWNAMMPALEVLFDRLAGADEFVRIPRIEIDMGILSVEALLSDDFILQVTRQIEKEITYQLSQNGQGVLRQPISVGQFERWLFFLEFGYLPYEASSPDSIEVWHQSIFETLAVDHLAIRRLGVLVETVPQAFYRLLHQYDGIFLEQIIGIYTGYNQQTLSISIDHFAERIAEFVSSITHTGIIELDFENAHEMMVGIEKAIVFQQGGDVDAEKARQWAGTLSQWIRRQKKSILNWTAGQWAKTIRKELWREVLKLVIVSVQKLNTQVLLKRSLSRSSVAPLNRFFEADPDSAAPDILLQALRDSRQEKHLVAGDDIKQLMDIEEELLHADAEVNEHDVFYLQHAGIVLLHPFYPTLFEKLGLTNGEVLEGRDNIQQALSVLHFIGTGKLNAPEYQLVLAKLLCGTPLNLPVNLNLDLAESAQMEAEGMMQAAIAHWDGLGTVSPDGLREGFLQRPGKLSRQESGWVLQVEPGTIDILLDRLPWNLSLLKLPWMENFLRVDWR